MPLNPDELEEVLTGRIQRSMQVSPEDTLLGFVDVEESTQREILEYLRPRAGFMAITRLLRDYPAMTSYGLAVAAPIGLQDEDVGGGAFYGAWNAAFGYFPSPNDREPLALCFVEALEKLGLTSGTISPDREIHWHGGCYLFHAAILPHFVDPLRGALESAQRIRPLPDPDDDERAGAYACFLAERVPPGQQRLRKTLQSTVGSFLVRRLVRWLLTGDDSLFPAHIKPLLQEQKGRGAFLRSPSILFDETTGQLQLVLPAQTANVADSQTRWACGKLEFRASSERPPMALEELDVGNGPFDVTLSRLKDGREDITFHLQAAFPADRGFRIFEATGGKERRMALAGNQTIELTPGQHYLVVLHDSTHVRSGHVIDQAGDSRYVRYEVVLGSDPLDLEFAEQIWTLKPKIRPGIYFTRADARAFQAERLTDGKEITVSYGSAFSLTCGVPEDVREQAMVRFETRLNPELARLVNCPQGVPRDGVRISDLSASLMTWLQTLPAAVHLITISLECAGRKMTYEWLFWKGLERISVYGDFYCNPLPTNLIPTGAFEQKGQALVRKVGQGPPPVLGFRKVGPGEVEKWEVPANRVKIVLVDMEGSSTELDEKSEIDVLRDDGRSIHFRTGGLLPIRLMCDGSVLGEISIDRPVLSRFLSTIAADLGRTGVLKAEALIDLPGNTTWTVLSWRTPQTAKECRLEQADDQIVIWLIRKISIIGVASLRMKLIDLRKRIEGTQCEQLIDLEVPTKDDTTAETKMESGFVCSVRRKPDQLVQVMIRFDRAEQKGAVWVTELECRLDGSAVWQPVMSQEAHGRLAVCRLIFIGKGPQPDEAPSGFADLFWGNPLDPLTANSPVWSLKGDQLDHWLDSARWLIECRYASPVWKQNGFRLKSLYERLSAATLMSGNDKERHVWWKHAVRGLDAHALESQPVVTPCLLLNSNSKMAATSLRGCGFDSICSNGIVARAFGEAMVFESRTDTRALNYVRGACEEGRIDIEFISRFSGFGQLLSRQRVDLGDFSYGDWLNQLRQKCLNDTLASDADGLVLMSAKHFIYGLSRALRRLDPLVSVSDQETGHWLSAHIANLRASEDRITASIRSILGPRLAGTPAEIFLRPLDGTLLLQNDTPRLELLRQVMNSACLLALCLRAKNAGIINTVKLEDCLRSVLGGNFQDTGVEGRVAAQTELILGTAPELFSFYFLLFTLSLKSTPHDSRD